MIGPLVLLRNYVYTRRALRCARRGHERIVAERAGRIEGLCVIEQRLECGRCGTPFSDWTVVLSEATIDRNVETLWK